MSDSPLVRLEAFAAAHHAVFTDRQARERGVSTRMLERARAAGRFERVLPRTYRVSAMPRTFRGRAMAAVAWSGGLASHATAGRLWRIEGIVANDLHVTVARRRRCDNDLVTVHRTDDLLPADCAVVEHIALTSALRTVIDLAAMIDTGSLERAIEDGLRRRLFTIGQLRWRVGLRSGPGVGGSRSLERLLGRRLGDTGSDWELKVARILTGAGLPEPLRQVRVVTESGVRFGDLGYPGEPAVIMEYDSDRWHSTPTQRHRDAERRNEIRVAGGLVVEITPALIRRPEALVSCVRAALRTAGRPTPEQGTLLGA